MGDPSIGNRGNCDRTGSSISRDSDQRRTRDNFHISLRGGCLRCTGNWARLVFAAWHPEYNCPDRRGYSLFRIVENIAKEKMARKLTGGGLGRACLI